jgi:drug/metabolite transporter (DMT)-like permease
MSSYRQHSFDPNAYQEHGRPMRPFNKVQWAGVGLGVLGIALYAVYFAGRFGLTQQLLDSPMFGFAALIFGVVLVNSRRHPAHDVAPELAAARRRWLVIISVVCAAIIGAAVVIELTGAN